MKAAFAAAVSPKATSKDAPSFGMVLCFIVLVCCCCCCCFGSPLTTLRRVIRLCWGAEQGACQNELHHSNLLFLCGL